MEIDPNMPNQRFFAPEGLSSAKLKSTGFAHGFSGSMFEVYPNPTTGKFSIFMGDEIPMDRIEIYDSRGQLINRNIDLLQGAGGIVNIDLNGLPSGMYPIKVKADDHVYEEKIVLH